MIKSIVNSRNAVEKRKMEYKSLKFFVLSSKSRLKQLKGGCRLATVIDKQQKENSQVFLRISIYETYPLNSH